MLVAAGYVTIGYEAAYFKYSPSAWLLSWALLLPVAAIVLAAIDRFALFEREPRWMMAVAVLWGGLIAMAFSVYANSYFLEVVARALPAGAASRWGLAIVAPLVEGTAKLAGLLALFLVGRRFFVSPADGLIYGSAIGLGFQTVENHLYLAAAGITAAPGGRVHAVLSTFVDRVIGGGLISHTLYTGLIGCGFAFAMTQTHLSRRRRYGLLALAAVVSWSAHFLWNSPLISQSTDAETSVAFGLLATVVFVAVFWLAAAGARRHERTALSRLILAAVEPGIIDASEVRVLASPARRVSLQVWEARNRGYAAARLARRLQEEQLTLARLRESAGPYTPLAVNRQRRLIGSLKKQIAGLPPGWAFRPRSPARVPS